MRRNVLHDFLFRAWLTTKTICFSSVYLCAVSLIRGSEWVSVAIYCELMTCHTDETKVDIHYGALAIENVKKLDLLLFFQNRSKSRI